MEHYVGAGYVRRVNAVTWCLPIFKVRNPAKPEKVRIVWDAAAKDLLMSGSE